jgi:hypothetical protein
VGRKLVLILVVAGLFAVVAALAYRPAAFIGVHSGALAYSVGEEDEPGFDQECVDRGDGVWSCRVAVKGGDGPQEFAVRTRSLGCWDAWEGREPPGSTKEADRSGCITALDFLYGD